VIIVIALLRDPSISSSNRQNARSALATFQAVRRYFLQDEPRAPLMAAIAVNTWVKDGIRLVHASRMSGK
jgi:hypothetical protein